jgi:hypothetical protein
VRNFFAHRIEMRINFALNLWPKQGNVFHDYYLRIGATLPLIRFGYMGLTRLRLLLKGIKNGRVSI